MQQKIGRKIPYTLVMVITLSLIGCDEDKELAELAKEANRQQAQQNQEMAKVNREVAAASKRVVQASAEALGTRQSEELTAEFYGQVEQSQHIQQLGN